MLTLFLAPIPIMVCPQIRHGKTSLTWPIGGAYTHHAGDQFIFKGGVTWTSNCFPLIVATGGASSAYDYYGVNKNWYAGSSWTRPSFNSGYNGHSQMCLNGLSYIVIDSLDMGHIAETGGGFGWGVINAPFCEYLTVTNCHIHDWLFPPPANGPGLDDAHGGYFGNYSGGVGITNVFLLGCEIDNSENGVSGMWNGVCVYNCGVISNCLIHDNGSLILLATEVADSSLWDQAVPYVNYDNQYHLNMYYMDNPTGQAPPAFPCKCHGNRMWNCGGESSGLIFGGCCKC